MQVTNASIEFYCYCAPEFTGISGTSCIPCQQLTYFGIVVSIFEFLICGATLILSFVRRQNKDEYSSRSFKAAIAVMIALMTGACFRITYFSLKILQLFATYPWILAVFFFVPNLIIISSLWSLLVMWATTWNKVSSSKIPFPKKPWIWLSVAYIVFWVSVLGIVLAGFAPSLGTSAVFSNSFTIVGVIFLILTLIVTLYVGGLIVFHTWKYIKDNQFFASKTKMKVIQLGFLVIGTAVILITYGGLGAANPSLYNLPESPSTWRDRTIGFLAMELAWTILILATFTDLKCGKSGLSKVLSYASTQMPESGVSFHRTESATELPAEVSSSEMQ